METQLIQYIVGSNAGAGLILVLGLIIYRKQSEDMRTIFSKLSHLGERIARMEGALTGLENSCAPKRKP